MNWIDWILISILGFSGLIGLFRGFSKEFLSLVVWVSAMTVASKFTGMVLEWDSPIKSLVTNSIKQPSLQFAAVFVLLFLFVLIFGGLINFLIARLIAGSPLAGLNRFLGMLFGLVRGSIIAGMIVRLVELTPLKNNIEWQAAALVQPLQQVSHQLWTQLSTVVMT